MEEARRTHASSALMRALKVAPLSWKAPPLIREAPPLSRNVVSHHVTYDSLIELGPVNSHQHFKCGEVESPSLDSGS